MQMGKVLKAFKQILSPDSIFGEGFKGFKADSLPRLHFLHKTASVEVATSP